MNTTLSKKFVASNHLFYYYPLDYALDCIRDLGFSQLEFFGGTPHLYIDSETIVGIHSVIETVAQYNLKIVSFRAETISKRYRIGSEDTFVRKKSIQYFQNTIRAAFLLGAKQIIIDIRSRILDSDYSLYIKRVVADLKQLALVAKLYEVAIIISCVRQEQTSCIHSIYDLSHIIDEINEDNVGIALSTSIMAENGESISQWFRIFGNRILHINFIDGSLSGDRILGDGCLPMDNYYSEIISNRYQGLLGQWLENDSYFLSPKEVLAENSQRIQNMIEHFKAGF